MKTGFDHLTDSKQRQILLIVDLIREAAQPEKIILFGSYAKGKQVEHRYIGKDGTRYEYISDYDFLVVTRKNNIKEYELEDIINNRIGDLEPSVNIQVHEIDYINEGLEFGQYFFSDIINEGIILYDTATITFADARILTKHEEQEKAQRYFDIWFPQANEFLIDAGNAKDRNSNKNSAFYSHQATESLYYATLLVFTGYKPKTHNIGKLRKMAKILSEELYLLFPIETSKSENHLFDLLKRGYIDARYKPDYTISTEELESLHDRIKMMQGIVEKLCMEKITSIR